MNAVDRRFADVPHDHVQWIISKLPDGGIVEYRCTLFERRLFDPARFRRMFRVVPERSNHRAFVSPALLSVAAAIGTVNLLRYHRTRRASLSADRRSGTSRAC